MRQLEDRYAARDGDRSTLEKAIVALSLRFQVLCRFTAYVAVDRSEVVNKGGGGHRITQPVEQPDGWTGVALGGGVKYKKTRGFVQGRQAGGQVLGARSFDAASPPPPAMAPPRVVLSPDRPVSDYDAIETVDFLMASPVSAAGRLTLEGFMPVGRAWAPRDAATLVAAVAETVQKLHDQGFVHGDLSPSEIPMDDEKCPGLSRIPDGWRRPARRPEGEPLVITAYTAPDRIGNPTGILPPGVDVYSLGVILYVLLTGQTPFPPTGKADLRRRILQETPPPPRKVRRPIPATLNEICLKALARDPGSRYATAGELSAALGDFLKPQRKAFWR